jgi:hypothetical protein
MVEDAHPALVNEHDCIMSTSNIVSQKLTQHVREICRGCERRRYATQRIRAADVFTLSFMIFLANMLAHTFVLTKLRQEKYRRMREKRGRGRREQERDEASRW